MPVGACLCLCLRGAKQIQQWATVADCNNGARVRERGVSMATTMEAAVEGSWLASTAACCGCYCWWCWCCCCGVSRHSSSVAPLTSPVSQAGRRPLKHTLCCLADSRRRLSARLFVRLSVCLFVCRLPFLSVFLLCPSVCPCVRLSALPVVCVCVRVRVRAHACACMCLDVNRVAARCGKKSSLG